MWHIFININIKIDKIGKVTPYPFSCIANAYIKIDKIGKVTPYLFLCIANAHIKIDNNTIVTITAMVTIEKDG